MTKQQIERIIMAQQETSAVASKSIWGHILSSLGLVTEIVDTVAQSGVVPPHTGLVLVLIGNLLGLVGRLNPDIKPITSVLPK